MQQEDTAKSLVWWYIQWPEEVRRRTIRFITTIRASDGTLVSINVLEYAAMIITYLASYYVLVKVNPSAVDPYPVLKLWADKDPQVKQVVPYWTLTESIAVRPDDQQSSGHLGGPCLLDCQHHR